MENRKIVVNIRNVVTRLPELRFEEPLNWIIEEGQPSGPRRARRPHRAERCGQNIDC